MSPTIFLRIASMLTLLNCVLHTVGGVFGKPRNGAEEYAVIETMKGHQFNVMGSLRAYWDFFFGYGLSVTVTLFVQCILFWQLSNIIKTYPAVAKPIVLLFIFNCVLISAISWKYFFAGPGITQLLIAAALAAAYFTAPAAP